MEPLYNGQVGAGAFVRYSEVSFIGKFRHNHVNLTPYQFILIIVSYKFNIKSNSGRIDNWTPNITVYVVASDFEVKISCPA